MGASTLCPSAQALVEAILAKDPGKAADLGGLCKAHTDYMYWVSAACPTGRDRSIAVTEAETSFFRALKAIGDEVLKPEEDANHAPGGDGPTQPT